MKKAKNIFQFSALLLTLVLVQNIKVMANVKNIVGKTYGKLTVISYSHSNNGAYWLCRCECGRELISNHHALASGKKGCKYCSHQTHGLSKTKEFKVWQGIQQRCHNPDDTNFHKYGMKGISVCKRWRDSFMNFYSDMGQAPTKRHTLDRIESTGNYEPGNCRWATYEEQNNNRSCNVFIELNGESKTLPQWCRAYGLDARTVRSRIYEHGWSVIDALTTPPIKRANNRS